jgi:hypothetical protein
LIKVLYNSAPEVKAAKPPVLFCNGYLTVTAENPILDLQKPPRTVARGGFQAS